MNCTRCNQPKDAPVHEPLFRDPYGHAFSDARVEVIFTKREMVDDHTAPTDFDGLSPERQRSFDAGNWSYVGIMAQAEIVITRGQIRTHHRIESAGLWGIESDSGKDYLDEVFKEECDQLRQDIEAIATGPITWGVK